MKNLQLSDIRGVGKAMTARLQAAGFDSVERVAEASSRDLLTIRGIGRATVETVRSEAQRLVSGAAAEKSVVATSSVESGAADGIETKRKAKEKKKKKKKREKKEKKKVKDKGSDKSSEARKAGKSKKNKKGKKGKKGKKAKEGKSKKVKKDRKKKG